MKPTITDHFRRLGAPLRNHVNSWGAEHPNGSIVLRVWKDRARQIEGKWYRLLLSVREGQVPPGYIERREHIAQMMAGAPGYAVIVTAVDTEARPRKIAYYNDKVLVPLGVPLVDKDGSVWAECLPPVPILALELPSSPRSTGIQALGVGGDSP